MDNKMYTNDGIYIAPIIRDFLNAWEDKPCPILFEDFGNAVPSMMFQQLSAAEILKTYVNGSYVGQWSFSVYIRVNGIDTATRFDAVGSLNKLAQYLVEANVPGGDIALPEIDEYITPTKIKVETMPSIAMRYDDGTEDYQMLFNLEYKMRRNKNGN